jgi:hypothetical protein
VSKFSSTMRPFCALAVERRAQAVGHRAFDLGRDLVRVDRVAAIEREHHAPKRSNLKRSWLNEADKSILTPFMPIYADPIYAIYVSAGVLSARESPA